MRNLLLFIAFLFVFTNCGDTPPKKLASPQKTLKEAIPGIWETISFKVTINSVEGMEDSTAIFEVTEEEWEKRLGIKPIRTYYELDNRFRSTYRAYGTDSIINETKGLWNVFGDTLMLIEPQVTYTYNVELRDNGTGVFRSFLDWDGDEIPDDEYIGVQRLVSRTTQE